MREQSNKLGAFAAYGIGYNEQLNTTGGRCTVKCVGYGYFTDGTTEYDLLYENSDGTCSMACAPDEKMVPYNYGDIVAVYP